VHVRFDQDSLARDQWAQLPSQVRKAVIDAAGRGRACDDPQVARIALGWAWAVLGRPDARRRVGWFDLASDLVSNLLLPEGKGSFQRVDIFDGAPHHDLNLVVRSAARKVEAANISADGAPR
jgi:hypothetical protein